MFMGTDIFERRDTPMTKISGSQVEDSHGAGPEALSSGLLPHTVHHDVRPAAVPGPVPVSIPAAMPGAIPGGAAGIEGGQEVCDVKHSHPDVVTSVRPELVSLRAAEALAATFSVLGDPTRVRLLDALAAQELCVCELAELVGMSESAVSHQLRLLRSLRLVRSRRNGRMVFYRLDDNHIRLLLEQGRRHIEEDTDLDLVDDEA
jgi:DNA-binding transcriptional ArsR family regulator